MGQDNINQGETNSSTQETQLSSQQKELAMREKELEVKIKLAQRNIWLTSPLIVACVSAVAGLIGSGITAILQGNATYSIERQKFEYQLIQNALKAPTQVEAAKQLVFLVDTGAIVSLCGNRLRIIAKTTPGGLPAYNPGKFSERRRSGLFDGRIGKIKVTNTTSSPIYVKLYHPDDPQQVFLQELIPGGKQIFLPSGPYGNDWGIRINDSSFYIIGEISNWNSVDKTFSYEYKADDVATSTKCN